MAEKLSWFVSGELQGSPVLNWSKVATLATVSIISIQAHTQRHLLRRAEVKESTVLQNLSGYMPQLMCFGGCIIVGMGYYTNHQPLHGSWTISEGTALLLSLSALFLRLWAIKSLQHFFTYKVGIRKDHRLIRSGPYQVLRHPSYTGTILSFAGVAYFAGLRSWTLLLPFVAAVAGAFCVRLVDEENVLLKAFGHECEEYFKRTWRLIPFLF